jgi:hypothetical protein
MPLFTLAREFDPGMSEAAREEIMVRTISAATWFPEVRWIRSYYVDEPGRLETLCLYEGPTLDLVRQHTLHCRVPFNQIREVEERLPATTIALTPEGANESVGAETRALFMVRRTFPIDITAAELGSAWMRTAQCATEIPDLSWVRTYWDDELKQSSCIFQAPKKATVEEHIWRSRLPAESVDQVGENHPALWADVYDSFGIPRHWEPTPRLRPVAGTSATIVSNSAR